MYFYMDIIFKLLLSAVLGALIGLERESKRRPAGLRTNVLVCLGSCLVQIINIDIFNQYKNIVSIDPARLGAQVISGIGFLGAGTIIREGASVKGLTTAAGLWVVACIGLAIGNGSYAAAILTAVFAYLTLTLMKGFEDRVNKLNKNFEIEVQMENRPGQLAKIAQVLANLNVNIVNIEFKENEGNMLTVYLNLKLFKNVKKQEVIDKITKEDGVYSAEEI